MNKLLITILAVGMFVCVNTFGAGFFSGFETQEEIDTWGAGTLETTIVHSGEGSIRLGYLELATMAVSEPGTLDFWMYDNGILLGIGGGGGRVQGPRAYLVKNGQALGIAIQNNSGLDSDNGYGHTGPWGGSPSGGSWFSLSFLASHAGTRMEGWVHMSIYYPGDGTFEIMNIEDGGGDSDGVPIVASGDANANFNGADPETGPIAIGLFGGRSRDNDTDDFSSFGYGYFDDLTWTPIPEPASLSLLSIAGLLLVRRR